MNEFPDAKSLFSSLKSKGDLVLDEYEKALVRKLTLTAEQEVFLRKENSLTLNLSKILSKISKQDMFVNISSNEIEELGCRAMISICKIEKINRLTKKFRDYKLGFFIDQSRVPFIGEKFKPLENIIEMLKEKGYYVEIMDGICIQEKSLYNHYYVINEGPAIKIAYME